MRNDDTTPMPLIRYMRANDPRRKIRALLQLFFKLLGMFVFALWLLGSIGIGHFALIYSKEKIYYVSQKD